jgi:hypothetical protein
LSLGGGCHHLLHVGAEHGQPLENSHPGVLLETDFAKVGLARRVCSLAKSRAEKYS